MQTFNEQSGRDVKMKRPLQERNRNGKAEHSMDRIEACSIKSAISRIEDHFKRNQDQEMDRMVEGYSVKLEYREGKNRKRSLWEPSKIGLRTSHGQAAISL